MGILGNVETGWFAQVAHACQAVSQASLNFVSCGWRWGANLYNNIEAGANTYIAGVNERAVNQALANGATQHQALSAGSANLEAIADPKTIEDLANLASHGTAVIGETVKNAVTLPTASPLNVLGVLKPLLIGFGILSGTYILAGEAEDRPWVEKTKFVIGKILKFAASGGVAGGLLLGGGAIIAGISLGSGALGIGGAVLGTGGKVLPALAMAGPWGAAVAAVTALGVTIAGAVGLWNAGAIGGMLLSGLGTAILAGVVVGVIAGAALETVFGFSGMDDAIEDKADALEANRRRCQMRDEHSELMAMQLRKQQIALAKQEHELEINHSENVPLPVGTELRQRGIV